MTYLPIQSNPPETVCPSCGVPCDHTPEQMQGFALDALNEAGALLDAGDL